MNYSFGTDIQLVKELLSCSSSELAAAIGVSRITLQRWISHTNVPSRTTLNAFYDYAFSRGIRINAIKAQLHQEQIEAHKHICLFHGAKTRIDGALSLGKSSINNDFGHGFYCGQSLEQSAMFVAAYPDSSLYIVSFAPQKCKKAVFKVDQSWMLVVAWHRGKLSAYAEHPKIKQLVKRVENADYVVAPIADNRMFEIIDSFIDGEITDIQCQHCLSATNLGKQYVFVSPKALKNVSLVERCFLSEQEKRFYLESKQEESRTGTDKAKVARRQFRGQGLYIEELLA